MFLLHSMSVFNWGKIVLFPPLHSGSSYHQRLCTLTAQKDLWDCQLVQSRIKERGWQFDLLRGISWQWERPGWEAERKGGWEAHTETQSPKAFCRSWEFECSLIASFQQSLHLLAHSSLAFPLWWHTGVISAEVEKVLILDVGPPRSIPNRTAHYWPDRYEVSCSNWNNGNRTLFRVG